MAGGGLVLEHGFGAVECAVAALGEAVAVSVEAAHDAAVSGFNIRAEAFSIGLAREHDLACGLCFADKRMAAGRQPLNVVQKALGYAPTAREDIAAKARDITAAMT